MFDRRRSTSPDQYFLTSLPSLLRPPHHPPTQERLQPFYFHGDPSQFPSHPRGYPKSECWAKTRPAPHSSPVRAAAGPLATVSYLLQNHILVSWPELKHMESNPYTKTLGWGWALLTTRCPLLTAPRSFVPLHRRAHGARIRGSAETVPLLPVSKPVEQHTGYRRGG
jgi:hypothetical protein